VFTPFLEPVWSIFVPTKTATSVPLGGEIFSPPFEDSVVSLTATRQLRKLAVHVCRRAFRGLSAANVSGNRASIRPRYEARRLNYRFSHQKSRRTEILLLEITGSYILRRRMGSTQCS
jgi:hypothetical protein